VIICKLDHEYVLNNCTRHLMRAAAWPEPGRDATNYPDGISEAWRFPVIGLMRDASDHADELNLVTFVYKGTPGNRTQVQVLGSFASLCEPIPLEPVLFEGEDTGYRAVSVAVPRAQAHTYRYSIDGRYILDPINPQIVELEDGRRWSRFFTDAYLQPLVLEPWELRLLYRLIEQILPFRCQESENFLKRYYFGLNREQCKSEMPKVYRLNHSVGEVNAIDKLLAREEAHRLADYRICLKQIDRVLRLQNPLVEACELPAEDYVQLFEALAASKPNDHSIPGWDYLQYDNPAYFLYLLRRHAVTAAFSHPKYGGNVGAARWNYLSERYFDRLDGGTLFDWSSAMERPLGNCPYYK
jgi:Gluconate 2-dehydrogenase subunit 3